MLWQFEKKTFWRFKKGYVSSFEMILAFNSKFYEFQEFQELGAMFEHSKLKRFQEYY